MSYPAIRFPATVNTRASSSRPRGETTDAVSFAPAFIANPDLVSRFALGHDLAASDRGTHYCGGARGYVDYPVWPGTRPITPPRRGHSGPVLVSNSVDAHSRGEAP